MTTPSSAEATQDRRTLLLSGVPGSMCREIARAAQDSPWRERFQQGTVAFSEPANKGKQLEVAPGWQVLCHETGELTELLSEGGLANPLVIDFSIPAAGLPNVKAYAAAGVPFVIGTTGFDAAAAADIVRASKACAVIAPNMATPIVVLQAALRWAAREFPGALSGYELSVTESHQTGKKDVSGTAKAFLPFFEGLGMKPGEPPITSVRDPEMQRGLGIPEPWLGGHAWHWYEASSSGEGVELSLSHRINGRRVYAEGTMRAAAFLDDRLREGAAGKAFDMLDVLRAAG